MKKNLLILVLILTTAVTHAQLIPLPPFLKWQTSNSPACKNVVLTKDSMVLPIKNKCLIEGSLVNPNVSVGVADGLHFSIPANAKIQLTVTYKFIPKDGDVLSFYGSYDAESDNSDEASSGFLRSPYNDTRTLPASNGFTKAIILVNFTNESIPVWKSKSATKGVMNLSFSVTTNGGETHQGSKAIFKEVKLEVIN